MSRKNGTPALVLFAGGCALACLAAHSFAQAPPPSSSPSTKSASPATAGTKTGGRGTVGDRGWPRLYTAGGAEIMVHQPQVDSWDDYSLLKMRLAVSVRTQGSQNPDYGVVDLEAKTVTDHAARNVTIYKPEITSVRFPNVPPDKAAIYEKLVRSIPPTRDRADIALDRVLAYVKVGEKERKGIAVNLDPPPIFYSDSDAILLTFLGAPRFVKIEGTSLEFGMNTSWDLIRDPASGLHYLLYRDGWIQAPDLKYGPWTGVSNLPKGLKSLPKGGAWDRVSQNVPGKRIEKIPLVFETETPSELIVTQGRPTFEPIPGTKLSWIRNSQNTLFFHADESRFYFLAAGRWFRAPELAGAWTAATTSLPPDFAKIPKDHAKASVLASVPGTQEAEDAILIATIPRVGIVNRKEARPEVSYDGDPKFERIEGTAVSAAVNTPNDVFKVGDLYYCCFQGVWFKAGAPEGPWEVADSVPDEIYKIPPTSPKHNVTYVKVVDSNDETVTDSYTAGYEGEVVSSGVVVYGVGYYYGYGWGYPWYYPPYYWGWGMYPPYYGGVTFWAGAHGYAWTAWGPYGGAGYGARYNPATGVYTRGGYAYGPGGGVAWRTGYNPSTGVRGAQRGGYNAYGSWKQGMVTNGSDWIRGGSISGAGGTLKGFQTSGGAAGIAGPDSGFVVKGKEGNVYAGKDGNVYRRDQEGNWSQLPSPKGGASASTNDLPGASTRPSIDSGVKQGLDSDYSSRQSGNARTNSYSGRGSYGGGRSFGGGGRRR